MIQLGQKRSMNLVRDCRHSLRDLGGKPQVFGTQFHGGPNFGAMTHDKINPAIVSDPMRSATCVVSTSEQDKVLEIVNHGGNFGSTHSKEDHCK
jgi:hypothetical protein